MPHVRPAGDAPLPASDMAIYACAICLEPAWGAEKTAVAGNDDEAFEAAAAQCGAIVETLSSYRAESIEGLLVQVRGLLWIYAGQEDQPVPDILECRVTTTEERLVRALVLGLLHLAPLVPTHGDPYAV